MLAKPNSHGQVPVAVYARYSTDRQDARSIDDQIRRCREYAAAHGLSVVREFSDKAQSGSHMARQGLQQMLTLGTARGGSPFGVVLVDDLSRLSRDLGDTWRIVFEQLGGAEVAVVDCSMGFRSDAPGAKTQFGLVAIMNSDALDRTRSQTHRGLQGRALGGFATGGRCYGFRTELELNPPDDKHIRKVRVAAEHEAAVVRRIFKMYAEGHGFAAIARGLNNDGILAPYDTVRKLKKRRGLGWSPGTVRALLSNERYIGRLTWNRRKWVTFQEGVKKKRRARMRDAAELVAVERPDLALVDRDLWDAVQRRLAEHRASGKGRPHGTGSQVHLLSGIARCGVCGGGMGVVGQRRKGDRVYITMGCMTRLNRGGSICDNKLTVSERKLNDAVFGALREILLAPSVLDYFVEQFNAHLRRALTATRADDSHLEREVGQAELSVRNVTDALARVGWSDALGQRLQQEEARLKSLKAQLSAQRTMTPAALTLPHPKVIQGYVTDMLGTLGTEPQRARELLRKHLGQIVLTPKCEGPDRHYVATGAFNLRAPIPQDQVLDKFGCGGLQPDLPTPSVPFEVVIPIGRAA